MLDEECYRNYKVLIAEDDIVVLGSMERFLKNRVGAIVCAHNGQEAYELYSSQKPDILMVDIKMPKMDGLELIKRIRKEDGIRQSLLSPDILTENISSRRSS